MREVPELGALLAQPGARPAGEGRRARRSCSAAPTSSSRNFLLLLVEKGRVGQLEEIAREFERLVAAEEGLLEVELTTAFELSTSEAARHRRADRAGVRPARSRRRARVDPDLIGGLVLQAGSLRVDASVRGRSSASARDFATA